MAERQLTLIEHLAELRKRLFIIVLSILAGSILSYAYVDKLIQYVLQPANQLDFVYLTPPELFLAYLQISLIIGTVVTSPITVLQIWLFVQPGLTKREKRYAVFSLLAGFVFFFLGAFFAYKVIIPVTLEFFVRISVAKIEPMFSFGSYIGFITSILLSFGIVFEMPMLVLLLAKLGLVTAATLRKYRKVLVLVILVVASFLTPPDVVSQLLLAGPMFLLFELSILLAGIAGRKRGQDEN